MGKKMKVSGFRNYTFTGLEWHVENESAFSVHRIQKRHLIEVLLIWRYIQKNAEHAGCFTISQRPDGTFEKEFVSSYYFASPIVSGTT